MKLPKVKEKQGMSRRYEITGDPMIDSLFKDQYLKGKINSDDTNIGKTRNSHVIIACNPANQIIQYSVEEYTE